MELNPYLSFNGNCQEAVDRYLEIFGGEIVMTMKYGESEDNSAYPEHVQDWIMHIQFRLRGQLLMASDMLDEFYSAPAGMNLQVAVGTLDDARKIFDSLAVDGTIRMPFEPTFWAAGFGLVTDRFSIPWMINCDNDGGSEGADS